MEEDKFTFAALRFTEDANIADNVYWYACALPVQAGERVLAPVGTHNRLQCARVERVVTAFGENAPYDIRLIKEVEAKLGARAIRAGESVCYELGGVRYDEKRYTRFRRILYTPVKEFTAQERAALFEYGVTHFIEAGADCEAEIAAALKGGGCVLVTGTHARKTAEQIIANLRGDTDYEIGKYLK